jgi:hypothetical protein
VAEAAGRGDVPHQVGRRGVTVRGKVFLDTGWVNSIAADARSTTNRETAMSFGLYFFGFLLFIAGVAWALVTAGVPVLYVAIACVILLGIGIMMAVTRTRPKDPPSA